MDCTRDEAAALLMELASQVFLRSKPLDQVNPAQAARVMNGIMILTRCTPERALDLVTNLTPEEALERIKR